MSYNITTLPNGMRVASEFLPGVESVAVSVSVGVGARYESAAENGISHLLEHMAFKGTKTRTARDIAEIFDAIGGQLNAYTSMEMTVYYAKVLKQDLEIAIDVLSDILQNSIFSDEELAREKEVIIQEIAMHNDTPDDLVVDYFDDVLFDGQALGRSILSTPENVSAFTRADLQSYMESHYRPQRMVVTAAGNVKHEDFVALVSSFFKMPQAEDSKKFEPAHYIGGNKLVTGDFEQLHMLIGLPAVSVHSPDYYTLQLYTTILGGGMSSRLFQEVREKRGLAYTVYASAAAYADVGVMSLYSASAPENGGELAKVLCEQIAAMATEIKDSELARSKNQQRAELLMARENPQTIATWIGRHLLIFGEYRPAAEIIKKIEAVSKEQLLNFAGNLKGGKLSIAALGDISKVPGYAELEKILS